MTVIRIVRPQTLVRAPRVDVLKGVIVESKTLGTSLSYAMGAENMSRTGLLLNVGRNRRVPFRVNTIIEMTVDPSGQLLERPVSCLGKVVRLTPADDGAAETPRYGVHIVQIDGRDLDVWERCLVTLEDKHDDVLQQAG